MIDHQYRCIFIHQRKVAGTSIMAAFGKTNRDPDYNRYNGGVRGSDWQGRTAPEDRYVVFSAVRNPFDRLVSAWRYLPNFRTRTLDEVLAGLPTEGHDYRHMTMTQTQMLIDSGSGRLITDELLRYETLQSDFDRLCERLGMPRRRLEGHKIGERDRDYRKYYTPATRAIVEELFQDDLRNFAYSF